MIKIRRLNSDSSYQLNWDTWNTWIDPWMSGPEIDGFSWLNKQHHVDSVLPQSEWPSSVDLVISQPYSDHCHPETLQNLTNIHHVFTVPQAEKKTKKYLKKYQTLSIIPDFMKGNEVVINQGRTTISAITPRRLIDPIYHAILFKTGDETIFYAPHGFDLKPEHLEALKGIKISLLITTFTWFKIPEILGGLVNPGIEAVLKLNQQLDPRQILQAHDEEKGGSGLVLALAKKKYPEYELLPNEIKSKTIFTKSHEWLKF